MIFPRLCINANEYSLELYEVESPDDPFLTIVSDAEQTCTTFFHLLDMALDNYDAGYEAGYNDAVDEFELDEGIII